ncbi:hypothetical protein BD626DRAFT_516916 [Schizophyllum amplum]|uniref:Uncharacterized protein n=1 Tax=Schizophyllum amplum TaxID=97359 RepID=A0A550BWM3_9AGAR|nr:hypothetical protein BD626DRAFT_516916 [Auriculariopsis ampla]
MAGTKRAAEAPATRASKAAKMSEKDSPASAKKAVPKKGGNANKKVPKTSDFKASAMPLHINVTHTPPAMAEKPSSKAGDKDEKDVVSASHADPGSLGSLTLVPSVFTTGSYGWKGSKRIQVELMNSESGKKRRINATVLGSKGAGKDDKAAEEENGKDEEEGDKDEDEEADSE